MLAHPRTLFIALLLHLCLLSVLAQAASASPFPHAPAASPPFGNVYPPQFVPSSNYPGQYFGGGYNINSLAAGGWGGYPAGYGYYHGCSIPGFIEPGCYKPQQAQSVCTEPKCSMCGYHY